MSIEWDENIYSCAGKLLMELLSKFRMERAQLLSSLWIHKGQGRCYIRGKGEYSTQHWNCRQKERK